MLPFPTSQDRIKRLRNFSNARFGESQPKSNKSAGSALILVSIHPLDKISLSRL